MCAVQKQIESSGLKASKSCRSNMDEGHPTIGVNIDKILVTFDVISTLNIMNELNHFGVQ